MGEGREGKEEMRRAWDRATPFTQVRIDRNEEGSEEETSPTIKRTVQSTQRGGPSLSLASSGAPWKVSGGKRRAILAVLKSARWRMCASTSDLPRKGGREWVGREVKEERMGGHE